MRYNFHSARFFSSFHENIYIQPKKMSSKMFGDGRGSSPALGSNCSFEHTQYKIRIIVKENRSTFFLLNTGYKIHEEGIGIRGGGYWDFEADLDKNQMLTKFFIPSLRINKCQSWYGKSFNNCLSLEWYLSLTKVKILFLKFFDIFVNFDILILFDFFFKFLRFLRFLNFLIFLRF